MFSGPEIWIVAFLVVLLFGGSQLPKLAKNIGKAQKEFKDGLADANKSDTPVTPVTPVVPVAPVTPVEPVVSRDDV